MISLPFLNRKIERGQKVMAEHDWKSEPDSNLNFPHVHQSLMCLLKMPSNGKMIQTFATNVNCALINMKK